VNELGNSTQLVNLTGVNVPTGVHISFTQKSLNEGDAVLWIRVNFQPLPAKLITLIIQGKGEIYVRNITFLLKIEANS